MMETFRSMVNECVRVGIENDVSTLKRLSVLCYHKLDRYDIMSYYRLYAISHATGILANRKKSIKRGFVSRNPYSSRPFLVLGHGFKIIDGILKVPLGDRKYFHIPLNSYTRQVLSAPTIYIRSFTLTSGTINICYSKEVVETDYENTVGVDRNLRNLTVGNYKDVVHYDLSKAVDIAENTRSIMRSFRRNDVRIRKKLYARYASADRIGLTSCFTRYPKL